MKFGLSPFTMGLLGGVSGYAQGAGKYYDMERQLEMRLNAYKYRYDRMADVQKQREDFNERQATRKLDALRRSSVSYTKDDNGQIMRNEIQSVWNNDTNQWEDHTKSSIPLSQFSKDSSKAQTPAAKKLEWDSNGMHFTQLPDGKIYSSPKWNPDAGARGGAGRGVTPTSQFTGAQTMLNAYSRADEGQKREILAENGIDPDTVTDPKDRYAALERAVESKVRSRAGRFGGDQTSAAPGGMSPAQANDIAQSPDAYNGLQKGKDGWYTPDGQKVLFKNGQGWLQARDKNGKPIEGGYVPYNPQPAAAPGGAPTSSVTPQGVLDSENNDDEVNQQIAGLGGEDNTPPEQDDEEDV